MKIRSITGFLAPKNNLSDAALAPLAKLVREAAVAYKKEGFEVQTIRLATTPFPHWIKPLTQSRALEAAVAAEAAILRNGFGYISFGPALAELPESYVFIPELLKATKNAFFGGVIAEGKTGINMPALRACAEVIQQASRLEANGFANLRFAALVKVPPGSPFFPAAYHSETRPAFAIATQAADLAVEAFEKARSVLEGSQALTASIEKQAKQIAKVGERLAKRSGVKFKGIDFSLAPFPTEAESLGTAFERMGVPAVGMHGSLAAAAILTQAIDAADFPHTGFSGLLLPPLEDATLAKRAAEGKLTVNDLLIYSAVCGTGLDTVPLPGDSSSEQLAALLLDVAALALRLNKPLTARLMPIPGKKAGDETSFDFAYFANSRVMELRAMGLERSLGTSEMIVLAARKNHNN